MNLVKLNNPWFLPGIFFLYPAAFSPIKHRCDAPFIGIALMLKK